MRTGRIEREWGAEALQPTVGWKVWRVENGLLIGSGPHSHLFSERGDYQNFRYRVEAMINDKGNSGQYFRADFAKAFPPGYEAQINSTHGDKVRTGSEWVLLICAS